MADLQVTIDGKKMIPSDLYVYRGMMFSNVPNLALATGYTNASWTLKSDLTCEFVCRLLNHMDKTGKKQVTPKLKETMDDLPLLDFTSGYVQRAIDKLPKQGNKRPWKLFQNYALDIVNFRYANLKDGVLDFK